MTLLDLVRFLILLSFYHVKWSYCRNDLNHFWINLWYPKFCHQINAIPSCWSSRAKVKEFDENRVWLDDFCFYQVFAKNYTDLPFVIKVVLTLSHDQAFSEQQFSINNTVLDNNMKEESIVARKHIIDHVRNKSWCHIPLK